MRTLRNYSNMKKLEDKNEFCLFHNFIKIDDIDVYEESNPYAHMGQLQICNARQCSKCGRIEVKSKGIYNRGWQRIKSYTAQKIAHTTQDDCVTLIQSVIHKGTPMVKNL